jgi:hypothetical protein
MKAYIFETPAGYVSKEGGESVLAVTDIDQILISYDAEQCGDLATAVPVEVTETGIELR